MRLTDHHDVTMQTLRPQSIVPCLSLLLLTLCGVPALASDLDTELSCSVKYPGKQWQCAVRPDQVLPIPEEDLLLRDGQGRSKPRPYGIGCNGMGAACCAHTAVGPASLPVNGAEHQSPIENRKSKIENPNTARRNSGERPLDQAMRIGPLFAPSIGFAGGLDVALLHTHLLPGYTTRICADLQAPANAPSFFGFPQTRIALTLDQVYFAKGPLHRTYAGFGVGMSFGLATRPEGKAFIGREFSSTLSAELSLHVPIDANPLVALQVRFPL